MDTKKIVSQISTKTKNKGVILCGTKSTYGVISVGDGQGRRGRNNLHTDNPWISSTENVLSESDRFDKIAKYRQCQYPQLFP